MVGVTAYRKKKINTTGLRNFYLLELQALNFHTTTHQNEPFFIINLESDALDNALPTTILQSQPKLGENRIGPPRGLLPGDTSDKG
jgi:hypothetical protein